MKYIVSVTTCVLLVLLLSAPQAAAQTPMISRGPYLQVVTPTSVILRWRTTQPMLCSTQLSSKQDSVLRFQTERGTPTLDHSLTLGNLQPNTLYSYTISSGTMVLASGPDYYLKTAPPVGDTRPFRMWVLGDFGNGTDNQRLVYQAYRNVTATHPADLWLWLGDNAYCCGTEDQFQQYVFNTYGPTLRNTPFYPTPGNHDYADSRTNFDIPYYALYSMPKGGEAGGVPSGSAAYFSANYGNVHLISLDSQALEGGQYRLYDTTGTQVQWLKRDLAANKLPWTIVFFHHPPYSKGSHNSDTEEQMRLLRENLTPILERYGVDLVMNGHSHGYERFYRMKGQTGLADTFDKTKHIAENTTARYDGSANSCPILTKGLGTVYVVNGSGGAQGGVSPGYPHGGMVAGYRGDSWGGSMLLDVNDNRLDAQFIAYDGSVQDKFTMMKNVSKVTSLTAEYGDTLQLSASWATMDSPDYRWATGATTRSIRYLAVRSGSYPVTVSDTRQCLTDQYNLTVLPVARLTTKTSASVCAGATMAVTASPENTTKAAGWQYDIFLSDASGSFVKETIVGTGKLNALSASLPGTLPAGTGYRLRARPRGIAYAELVPSDPFSVRTQPTATLTGSTTVLQGQPVSLTIGFTGEGPWRGTLSEGTAFAATATPTIVTVQPTQSVVYSVATVENSCGKGNGSGQASVTILLPTETENFAGGQLHIYPNPAQDVVYVDLSAVQKKDIIIHLRDGQSRALFQKKFGSTASLHEAIPMPATAGTYLLTIQAGQETITRKIVRQQ